MVDHHMGSMASNQRNPRPPFTSLLHVPFIFGQGYPSEEQEEYDVYDQSTDDGGLPDDDDDDDDHDDGACVECSSG